MKLVSWNVNGLRACMKKGFDEFFQEMDADFFYIQESKLQEGQIDFSPEVLKNMIWKVVSLPWNMITIMWLRYIHQIHKRGLHDWIIVASGRMISVTIYVN